MVTLIIDSCCDFVKTSDLTPLVALIMYSAADGKDNIMVQPGTMTLWKVQTYYEILKEIPEVSLLDLDNTVLGKIKGQDEKTCNLVTNKIVARQFWFYWFKRLVWKTRWANFMIAWLVSIKPSHVFSLNA